MVRRCGELEGTVHQRWIQEGITQFSLALPLERCARLLEDERFGSGGSAWAFSVRLRKEVLDPLLEPCWLPGVQWLAGNCGKLPWTSPSGRLPCGTTLRTGSTRH